MSKKEKVKAENSAINSANSTKNSTKYENKIYPPVFVCAAFMAVILVKIINFVIEFFGYANATNEISATDLVLWLLIIAPFMACCLGAGVLLAKLEKAILPRANNKYKVAFVLLTALAILLVFMLGERQMIAGIDIVEWFSAWVLILVVYMKHKQKSAKKCEFKPLKQGSYKLVQAVGVFLDYSDLDTPIHCVKHLASVSEAVSFCQRHFGLKECTLEFDEEDCAYITSGFDPKPPSFVLKAAQRAFYISEQNAFIEQIIIQKDILRYILDDKNEFYRLESVDDLEIVEKNE